MEGASSARVSSLVLVWAHVGLCRSVCLPVCPSVSASVCLSPCVPHVSCVRIRGLIFTCACTYHLATPPCTSIRLPHTTVHLSVWQPQKAKLRSPWRRSPWQWPKLPSRTPTRTDRKQRHAHRHTQGPHTSCLSACVRVFACMCMSE